jgi:hypothetical protein
VLYTFYPPLLASSWYYGGAFLLIGGSMIWVVLMIYNMTSWKRDNPGQPVPLAMLWTLRCPGRAAREARILAHHWPPAVSHAQ